MLLTIRKTLRTLSNNSTGTNGTVALLRSERIASPAPLVVDSVAEEADLWVVVEASPVASLEEEVVGSWVVVAALAVALADVAALVEVSAELLVAASMLLLQSLHHLTRLPTLRLLVVIRAPSSMFAT